MKRNKTKVHYLTKGQVYLYIFMNIQVPYHNFSITLSDVEMTYTVHTDIVWRAKDLSDIHSLAEVPGDAKVT